MDKVDSTIEAICDWIQKELKKDVPEVSGTAEMTKALAVLVTSRAKMLV